MTEEKKTTINVITTGVGAWGIEGLLPVGTKLTDIDVELFSSEWMKGATQKDTQRARAHMQRKEAARSAKNRDFSREIEAHDEVITELRDKMFEDEKIIEDLQEQLSQAADNSVKQQEQFAASIAALEEKISAPQLAANEKEVTAKTEPQPEN